jgi:SAM-dependent MidA family methyltransferase
LNTPTAALTELIRTRILADGPVSFAWLMARALYHPELGYYSSGRAKLGRRGDYFTNVSVGPVFGRLIASQLDQMWHALERPKPFVILEQGAHTGDLARDILSAMQESYPQCYQCVHYIIVEPFPVLRGKQERTLAGHGGEVVAGSANAGGQNRNFSDKISWHSSLEAVEPFVGVHLSNELLDAMPVHLVRRANSQPQSDWNEKRVDWKNGEFIFVEKPLTDPRLNPPLKKLPQLPAGFETEISLAALDWIDALSTKVRRGYVLIIDYGYVRENLHNRHYLTGSLQSRAEHRVLESPFHQLGCADITAHVDWTTLAEHARERGFAVAGFTDQHHFLTGIIANKPPPGASNDPASRRQLQTLLHPEMMGRSFQVLALEREVESEPVLAGFQFGRNVGRELGL